MKRKREGNIADGSSFHPYLIADNNDNNNDIFFISDKIYAQELQFQEARISYRASSPSSSSSSNKKNVSLTESFESTKSPTSFCNICMDTKTQSEMFRNTNVCGHLFCAECIRTHIATKIKENQTKIKCPDPDCKGLIGPEVCRTVAPKEVLDRWENILCESTILERDKFYCPFKDCSVMMVVEDDGVTVTSSECPSCHRLFCAQCKVAWHCRMNCNEFRTSKKKKGKGNADDDDLVIKLAKKKRWMKCSKCNFFVEKVDGCHHIACRCGHHFCYNCGKSYPSVYHSCHSD